MQPKLFQVLGEILVLMSRSPAHRHYSTVDVLRHVLPAIRTHQFRIYRSRQHRPVAYVTWAKLSKRVLKKYLHEKYTLSPEEWNCGEHIVFTDFIAPFGHAKAVARDLKKLFSGKQGVSLRFDSIGKLRKVQSWKSSNSEDSV